MLKSRLFAATSLGGVLAALFCQPVQAQTADGQDDVVIVTASRRAEDVTSIPYNITAIGGETIERLGITSFESLATQVPNLNLNSSGDRSVGAQRPVMRGLNASTSNRQGQAQEQAPVATYLGNVPSPAGLFPIEDVERIEVLRGPQGTLYGAGALGGAVRILPTDPKLGEFSGRVAASVGFVSHSDDLDYGLSGILNVPLGDTAAMRVSLSHRDTAGFIDKFGVFVRQGGPFSPPVLVNPGDVANSQAALRNEPDSNWSKSDSARVSLKWAPTDAFEVVAAYNRAELSGNGGPVDNPGYPGGVDPIDPRITYPALDDYEVILRGEEPYDRTSEMVSLDASYDAGFATLSSTTSYTETSGDNVLDGTFGILALPAAFRPYYMGNPANPRFMSINNFADSSDNFTQEVRLVSQLEGPLQFVAGAYYQKEKRNDTWYIYIPGTPAQTAASGGFPVVTPPGDQSLNLAGDNEFTDTSLFGELTWNLTDAWQVTGGARLFRQTFDRAIDFQVPLFGITAVNSNSTEVEDSTFKLNTSYEYAAGHNVYGTISQGFRRGGANSFATAGFVGEPASLLDYAPDTVDNFEVGVKGRFTDGFRYSANVFLDNWHDPQIGLFTPINVWPVVVNGSEARSTGFEVEVSGSFAEDFSYDIGYAYSDAKLTKDFCLPVGDGGGGFIPCGLQGLEGTILPGAPKHTATVNLSYARQLADGSDIELSLNTSYKGELYTTLPSVNLINPKIEGFWNVNANASWRTGPWKASVFARNLLDERNVLSVALRQGALSGPLDDLTYVTRPRSLGVELSYDW